MRTALGVQAFIGNTQPLYRTAGNEMLGNDLFGILRLDASVPHGIRINHDRRAMLALVQAAGLIDPHFAAKTGLFRQLLEAGVQFALSISRARRTGCIGGA